MKKIDTSKWRDFMIGKLFHVEKGDRLTKADMVDGNVRFIGASAVNNGITHMIKNSGHIHPANTMTITYNGSVGQAFYQDAPYWASDDVNVLYPNFALTPNIAFFLIPILRAVGRKYEFKDKWKLDQMKRDVVKLPATSDGQPDWVYMESYIENIRIQMIKNLNGLQLL